MKVTRHFKQMPSVEILGSCVQKVKERLLCSRFVNPQFPAVGKGNEKLEQG